MNPFLHWADADRELTVTERVIIGTALMLTILYFELRRRRLRRRDRA